MASSNRRTSSSRSERQRSRSRSSSQLYRTTPNILVCEEDAQREETFVHTSRRNTQEMNQTKHSEDRPTTGTSSIFHRSRKHRSSLKVTISPSVKHRRGSQRKKSSISVTELSRKQSCESNDSENQDLTSQGLFMIPTEIFQLVTLRRLILSYNNLSSLPFEICSLINLEYLDLSYNPFIVSNDQDTYSCFPQEFHQLTNLQTLILTACHLKHIPIAIWQIISLQTLDLSRNKVGDIASDIGNLINIRHLRLYQMDLVTLPPEIAFCDQVEIIDLRENPLDNLPDTLIECRQLYALKINYKVFHKLLDVYILQLIDDGKIQSQHIPQVIFELENLRILDLEDTKINFIPNIQTLFNLTELYLSHNSFFHIPESVCTIVQLKILDMSSNHIHTVPEYLTRMKRLEILNLSNNEFTLLSHIFAYLPALKKLVISRNRIHTIDKALSQSQSLLRLDLSYNDLTYLPYEFCELERLELLDLRYNQLKYLPLSMSRMTGLKSMNTFNDDLERVGLHLLGNSITDPPGYVWKSTDIQGLFKYMETKEKRLSHSFYHLKLILIGPKNTGKTTLANKLVHNRKMVSNTRKTIDMYVSILQQRHFKNNKPNKHQPRRASDDLPSVRLTNQRIDNRISADDDYLHSTHLKIERFYPPPLKTYQSTEAFNPFLHKSTFVTKNNLYCTLLDVTSESSFEILYPLIYDSNAFYILPVNLTILLNASQSEISGVNVNGKEDQSTTVNFNAFLTDDWLYSHVFRYLESISDHCEQVFIGIIGLIDESQLLSHNRQQQQQLLDEIRSKVSQRGNINDYSDFFPTPIHINDEPMLTLFIEQVEVIARHWNILHYKHKQQLVKQRLGFYQQDASVINYDTCSKRFEGQGRFSLISSDDDDDDEMDRNKLLVEEEINQMSFDDCLDYLKLIGDILCFGQKPDVLILIKPYYLLNKIFASTLFRPHIHRWLDYQNNMVFQFSGYYSSQKSFDIDRERLLTRGEFTWNMLKVLFYEQNTNNINSTEQIIVDYCRLMQRLYLGYFNESNPTNTTTYFVCPWLTKEKCSGIDYFSSFKHECQSEKCEGEQSKCLKPELHGFPIDNELSIEENFLQTIKILNTNSTSLPNGLYERVLICLHPLFDKRFDYCDVTVGQTIDKTSIKMQRFNENHQIHLTTNNSNLLEYTKTLLVHRLFSFYPSVNLRIET